MSKGIGYVTGDDYHNSGALGQGDILDRGGSSDTIGDYLKPIDLVRVTFF